MKGQAKEVRPRRDRLHNALTDALRRSRRDCDGEVFLCLVPDKGSGLFAVRAIAPERVSLRRYTP